MERGADVIVVGGGVVGLAVADELVDAGAHVVLLEAEAAPGRGCSYGNAGLICPSHSEPLATFSAVGEGLRWLGRSNGPLYLHPAPRLLPWLAGFILACRPGRVRRATALMHRLASESLGLFREWAAGGRKFGFADTGILNVYESRSGLAAADAERLDAAEVAALEPAVAPTVAGGVLHAEAHCDPAQLVRELFDHAAAAGLSVRTRAPARSLRPRNGSIEVMDASGEVRRAETVVLATGVATRALARTVGVSAPLEGGKGYHLDLARGVGDPSRPLFLQEARIVITPFADRIRLSGTLEFGAADTAVSQARIDAIRRHAERVVPTFRERPLLGTWAGFRPCAPDCLPILGPVPGVPGLVLATGHAMLGLTLAPITGRLVRQMVARETTDVDVALLAPSRFR